MLNIAKLTFMSVTRYYFFVTMLQLRYKNLRFY